MFVCDFGNDIAFSEVMADIKHEASGIHRGRLVSCGQADAGGVFLHFHFGDTSEAALSIMSTLALSAALTSGTRTRFRLPYLRPSR